MADKKREAKYMIEELKTIGDSIKTFVKDFPSTVDEMKDLLNKNYSKIYAVGCGDSLYAPEAAKFAFLKNTGIDFQVIEAHEFRSYYVDFMPKNSLVFVSSNGGAAARTAECSYIAQKRGATVVAVTGSPKSRLAVSTDNVLSYTCNKFGHVPGTISFTALSTMFYVISARMGLWNGNLDAAGEAAVYEKLNTAADIITKTVDTLSDTVSDIMKAEKDRDRYYFLGAGPNYIMTEFGCAKFMEAQATDGIHQQLEEFAHEQYFVCNMRPDNLFFMLCPQGKCSPRAKEILSELIYLEQKVVFITTAPCDPKVKEMATYLVELPGQIDEDYTTIINSAVMGLFSYHLTMQRDGVTTHFRNEHQEVEHYTTIHYSAFGDEVKEYEVEAPEESLRTHTGIDFK